MRSSVILSAAITIVGILLAAFGGTLTEIQPPGPGINAGNFIGPFAALIILLIFSGLSNKRSKKHKRIMIGISLISLVVFVLIALKYFDFKRNHVVEFPIDSPNAKSYIVGDSLSEFGLNRKAYLEKSEPPATKEKIINNGGGAKAISEIWVDIQKVKQKLDTLYLLIMIFLAIAIFSITEGISNNRPSQTTQPVKPAKSSKPKKVPKPKTEDQN